MVLLWGLSGLCCYGVCVTMIPKRSPYLTEICPLWTDILISTVGSLRHGIWLSVILSQVLELRLTTGSRAAAASAWIQFWSWQAPHGSVWISPLSGHEKSKSLWSKGSRYRLRNWGIEGVMGRVFLVYRTSGINYGTVYGQWAVLPSQC